MTEQVKNIPKLRFPEFTNDEEWKERTLGQVGKFIGGGTPSTTKKEYWDGEIQWYTPTEVKGGKLSESERKITKLGLEKSSAKLLPIGTILITTRATIGDVGITETVCTTNQGFQSLKVYDSEVNIFWFYWIIQHRNELIKRAYGSTFKEINKTEIKKISVLSPLLKSEQQKIADCLSSLDDLITAHKEKLDVLKEHKKGLLQNLFPQEGETIPKYRFPEFKDVGEWKERKLEDFIKERQTEAEDDYPMYSLTIESGLVLKTERYERGFLVKNKKGAYKVAHPGDFAYNPMNLRFGAIAKLKDEKMVALSKYYNVFYCDESVDSSFCENYFRTYNMLVLYNNISTGSLIEKRRVHFSEFLKLEILFPSKEEQQKIAETLSSLDNIIEQQQQKIEELEEHKKGLLQGLFPEIED